MDDSFEILKEIVRGLELLNGKPVNLAELFCRALSDEAIARGAECEMLSIIGSWGDTLTDEELLAEARALNKALRQ